MPSITAFKGEFAELSRNNRFSMSGPACPPTPRLCTAIQVPAISVSTLEHREGTFAAPYKIPYDAILAEATLTFRENETFANRNFFEDWYGEVVKWNGFGYFEDFKRDHLKIIQRDRGGGVIKSWEIWEVYPISLSEIQYTNDSQNELTTWSVTLAYHDANWISD